MNAMVSPLQDEEDLNVSVFSLQLNHVVESIFTALRHKY